MILSTDNGHLIAKPVYNLILCIICESDACLGLIKTKIDILAEGLEEQLKPLEEHLVEYWEY